MGYQCAGGDAGAEGGIGPEGFYGLVGVGGLGEAGSFEKSIDDLRYVGLKLLGGPLRLTQWE